MVGEQCQVSTLTDGVAAQDLLVEQNSSLVFAAGEKECYADIRIFAIGGGGGGGGGAGGGSGYLGQYSVRMLSNNTDALVVTVGGGGGGKGKAGGSSRVEMGGHVLAEAAGGEAGYNSDGGNGYSGGGGGNGGHGGMDGGDGEDGYGGERGGHGSGQDLEMMVMEHFALTAGRGGNTSGGGGGGVLVNGAGPDLGLGVGQGYGGGRSYSITGGNKGCVLFELI